jgi:hypothetical protein
MYQLRIIRDGMPIYAVRRKRDLLVWRGQSILAYLLSQGAVGTNTNTWKMIISSNNDTPNMNDDSGDPEANEFSPVIGTPQAVTYTFEPTVKPNANMQTYAQLKLQASITVTSNTTVRKMGIIDSIDLPNRHIIVEDAVVPVAVLTGDIVEVTYFGNLW